MDVIVADDFAAVERAARPDTQILFAQTFYLADDEVLRKLDALPGDRLLVEPSTRTREKLAPEIRLDDSTTFGGADPDCDLREATRAGTVQLDLADTYEADGDFSLTRCYEGALVRYTDDGRTTTVVGSADFMTNSGLLTEGNAALAMNLAGTHPRLIWYAPQRSEGETQGVAKLSDLMPDRVMWIVVQLCLVVALLALWKARRSARWWPNRCRWWCGHRRPSRAAAACTDRGAPPTAPPTRCAPQHCSGCCPALDSDPIPRRPRSYRPSRSTAA